MSSTPTREHEIALALIDAPTNVRDLDPAHVDVLAASIGLRGLIVPLAVRPAGERFELVAGFHRHAACAHAKLTSVPVVIRDQGGESADRAAENVVRKQLSPLEEARAVAAMLEQGYTLDGAATVLGWARQRVTARAKILELTDPAQQLIATGDIPVAGVDQLLAIAAVSTALCELVVTVIGEALAEGNDLGVAFARDPGWVIGQALRDRPGDVWATYLNTANARELTPLKLGKKTEALLAEAEKLHGQLDRYAYGPPAIRFTTDDVDQARAAGVLLEVGRAPIVVDRGVYRELAKTAIQRTVDELRARAAEKANEKTAARREDRGERTPLEDLETDHRAAARDFAGQAHGSNLDLGAALLDRLATVDPTDMTVARFFAYAALGPDTSSYLGTGDHTARIIAANGIRLMLAEHRTTDTPALKNGKPGKTKVTYTDPDNALKWLWTFVDGAKTAGELYGRTLVVFAAQHYASQLALPTAQRRGSAIPRSHKNQARIALEKLAKPVLPATHTQLAKAIEREAREHRKHTDELRNTTRDDTDPTALDEPTVDDQDL